MGHPKTKIHQVRKNKINKKRLSRYFDEPITDVAVSLNMCSTILKKKCRKIGIKRWPYRKFQALKLVASDLHMIIELTTNDPNRSQSKYLMGRLIRIEKMLRKDPNLNFGDLLPKEVRNKIKKMKEKIDC